MTDKLIPQLEKAIDNQDEAKVQNLIERILSVEPSHSYALHCKAVLHMHQGKHQLALTALEHFESAVKEATTDPDFIFQKAYCKYRLQQYVEARATLSTVEEAAVSTQGKHLLAQIAYNLEEFKTAADIYEDLLASDAARDDEERQEIITNLAAAYVTLDAKKATEAIRKADEKTADMLFNAAAAELEARQYDQAMQTLSQAETIILRQHTKSAAKTVEDFTSCEALAAKASPERALFEDISPVWVQKAYVHYARGEEDSSTTILAAVLKNKVSSVAVNAVASLIWAAIKRHKDFFDTHRKLKQVLSPVMMARLTTKQKLLVRYNSAMLLLNIGNLAACKKAAETLLRDHPQSELGPMLLLAAHVRSETIGASSGKKVKASTKVIEDLLTSLSSRTESRGLQSRLLYAQVRLDMGDVNGALAELQAAEDVSLRIGFVVTAADWLIRASEFDKAVQLVEAAMKRLPKATTRNVLVWVTRKLLQFHQHAKASALLTSNGVDADAEVAALSVLALAESDEENAIVAAKKLPSSTVSNVIAASVDGTVVLPSKQVLEAAGFKRPVEDEEKTAQQVSQQSRRKPRPMRRPAKTVANAKWSERPDPERWLPMSIRPSIKDLPERRKKELKRLRAADQEEKRKAAEKRKLGAAQAATTETTSHI